MRSYLILLSLFLGVTHVYAQEEKFKVNNVSAELVTSQGEKNVCVVSTFTLKGMKNQRVKVGVSFSQYMLEQDYSTENAEYVSKGFHYREVFVSSNNEKFDDFRLTIPFDQINLLPGRHKYNVHLQIMDSSGRIVHQTYDKRHGFTLGSIVMSGPTVKIQYLGLDQNVYEDGKYGLRVNYKYDSSGLKNKNLDIYAYLVDESAHFVKAQSYSYSFENHIAQSKQSLQPYDNTTAKGNFFFPNSAISPYYGEHQYCILLVVCDPKNKNMLSDVQISSWFYATQGDQYTSSTAKPKSNNNNYASSYASSGSSSKSYNSGSSSGSVVGAIAGIAAVGAALYGIAKLFSNDDDNYTSSSSSSSNASISTKKYSSEDVARLLSSGNLYACRFKDGSNMTIIDAITRARIIIRSGEQYMEIPEWVGGTYKLLHGYSHTLKGGACHINVGGDNWWLMDSSKNIILY